MALKTFKADPDSELDYSINWTDWLTADTIAASEWFADSTDVELYNDGISTEIANTTYTFIRFLDAVEEGDEFIVTNRITTASTPVRIEDSSFKIVMIEK